MELVSLWRQRQDPPLGLHEVEEVSEKWCRLQSAPAAENNELRTSSCKRDVNSPPIFQEISNLVKARASVRFGLTSTPSLTIPASFERTIEIMTQSLSRP